MNKVRWIQLSDLHFGDDSPYSQKSREAFQKFVSEECKDIDYIFITGDIIYAKNLKNKRKRNSAYKEAGEYLKKIYYSVWGKENSDLKVTDRIFIVPGNHDLIRNDARSGSIKSLLSEYAKKTDGKIDSSYLDNTRQAMKDFTNFYKNLLTSVNTKKLTSDMHYVFETEKINILHINTCISSGSDGDDGKLIVGFELLSKALDSINNNKPTIAIAHHNFDCLNKDEQKKIELLLKEKNIFLYLCGHAHERESNLVLRYNQTKILNTYTCGTLMSEDGDNKAIDTVFFYGELDVDSCNGLIKSYIWNLSHGWHDDKEFGLVQHIPDNYRMFCPDNVFDEHRVQLHFDGQKGIAAKIVTHQSPERNIAFYEMNTRIKKSLSIYGVGITSVSRNTELFDKILNSGGTVQLCMVHPDVFKPSNCINESTDMQELSSSCRLDSMNFCIYVNHIDQYVRKEYYDDIQRSYKRLLDYKEVAQNLPGKFQIKLLKSFIPISINIINDKTDDAELIIEYNMPFTSKRLLLQLNRKDNADSFDQIKDIFDIIWGKAGEV